MLGMIGYLVAAFFVAIILTIGISLFRPIKRHDDFLSWRILVVVYLLVVFAPYGWVEYLTRTHGQDMDKAVMKVVNAKTNGGKLDYYKVVKYSDGSARVIAVVVERSKWGGDERPVLAMTLEPDEEETWVPTEYRFVNSDERNKDSATLPPYY